MGWVDCVMSRFARFLRHVDRSHPVPVFPKELSMSVARRFAVALVAVCALSMASVTAADHTVPLKGYWEGRTISADPVSTFPEVQIVAAGGGQLSHLGKMTMVSPHITDVSDGHTFGDQIFTAANGDTLTAFCDGTPTVFGEGALVIGTLACEITGGTGRFAGATGEYKFNLTSRIIVEELPVVGYATVASIEGSISTVGSNQ
jgi:hypothetical protein